MTFRIKRLSNLKLPSFYHAEEFGDREEEVMKINKYGKGSLFRKMSLLFKLSSSSLACAT